MSKRPAYSYLNRARKYNRKWLFAYHSERNFKAARLAELFNKYSEMWRRKR